MIQYFPEAANRANTCTHVMGLLSWYKRQVALLILIWGYDSSQLFTRHRLDFTSITAAENITANSIVIKLSADWVSHLSLLYSVSVSVVNNMQIYKISKASRWANESLCCSLTACRYIHRLYAHLVTSWTDGGDVVIQWVNTLTPGESITSHLYSSAAKNYNAIKCQRRWTEPPLIECDDIIFVFATSQTLCCWIFPVKKHNDSLDSWLTRWTRVLTDVILSKSL